ncbi:MAG: hypothetical protein ACI9BW_000239 [Gammaproteobacteria bacterium]|jgi:hypothetical protein
MMQLFKRLLFSAALSCGVVNLSAYAAQVSLYDASQGNLPAQQGSLVFANFGTSETLAPAGVDLDSAPLDSNRGGYTAVLTSLNRNTGVNLDFALQIQSESHLGNANRAGFSTILLTNDNFGIELGFWENTIFAQDASFTSAESISFDTTGALTSFSLQILGSDYSLVANGLPILGGSLRDYSTSGVIVFGIPIYQISNYLFLGDDTQSAQAQVTLGDISITTSVVPVPPSILLMLSACLALASRRQLSA